MDIEYDFFLTVVDTLTRDRLVLPSLPQAAVRVGHMARVENVSAARLATAIGRDPAIAVRLLRVANSAAFSGNRSVDNLPQAVTRLGLDLTQVLVSGMALEQMFFSPVQILRERLDRSWTNSVEVAAMAQLVARRYTALNPETAMLAGLIHEVGALPIIRLAESHPEVIATPAALDEAVFRLHPRVGELLLKAWKFPQHLVDVPVASADLSRRHDGPADYADVVCAALLQRRPSREKYLAKVNPARVPACVKLGIDDGVNLLDLDELEPEFERTVEAFAS